MTDFVPLHLHTEYSIIDSVITIDDLMSTLKKQNVQACAITDVCNVFGVVKFYSAALKNKIKPIIGAEILLYSSDTKNYPKLVLLCQNQTGYLNLLAIISKAYREGKRIDNTPIVNYNWLTPESTLGLIALSGAQEGDIGQALIIENTDLAQTSLQNWLKLFPDNRFYIEIQRTNHPNQENYNHHALTLASQFNIPVVATNNARFVYRDDFDAHDARVCIHDGCLLSAKDRQKKYTEEQYLKSPAEMAELFQDIPEALANTLELAKRCNVELSLGKVFFPNFPVPEKFNTDSYLGHLANQGLVKRFEYYLAKKQESRELYQARLDLEVKVITGMGFSGYFLIVADFISWAKQNNIPVGPGRGSGAGSLVAYALGITDIDPIEYDLLFERFLNPERVSMPDFDIDFCMVNRDRVIEYVAQKYGREAVSQISTFGTMAARAVVRDCGRVLGLGYGFVDKIAKLIPMEIGMTLEKALEQEPLLADMTSEEEVDTLIKLALKLEGLTRNVGKHAGGVVIAPSKLTDFTALYCEDGSDQIVAQYDKDDIESIGLIKFDFLGLKTLTIIDLALQNIRAIYPDNKTDIGLIPLDDIKTYSLLKHCQTTAVFQLESRGMKDLIARLKPDQFEEIIALVALFRPGPLQSGMVDDFINRKHGRAEVEYFHPKIAPILKPTYGVILYQEQVMQIAQDLAGYTLGAADLLRRAMGKKKPEEMAQQREIFTKGAVERGVEPDMATHIFDIMEKFSGYGFNKSHSAAYALVSYQTAWLKAHFPAPFMAAVLTADMSNTDKVVIMLEEAKHMGLDVLAPNIYESEYAFTCVSDKKILYGLGAIKGVGEGAILEIIEKRKQYLQFDNLFDFCSKIDPHKVNRRVLEALIFSGAFDCLNQDRAVMSHYLEEALKYSQQESARKIQKQPDLFGTASTVALSPNQVYSDKNILKWDDAKRLQLEKQTLGYCLSGHFYKAYQAELSQFISCPNNQIANKLSHSPNQRNKSVKLTISGIVAGVRTMLTKKGDRMAFVTLDDETAKTEVVVFADLYKQFRELLTEDKLIICQIEVKLDPQNNQLRIRAQEIFDYHQARNHYAKQLELSINTQNQTSFNFEQFKLLLSTQERGNVPILIRYETPDLKTQLRLSPDWSVSPSESLMQMLATLLGKHNIKLCY
jgi:DNA polymerase-3 subunit alpha